MVTQEQMGYTTSERKAMVKAHWKFRPIPSTSRPGSAVACTEREMVQMLLP